jgi:LmbE family N-acetylglucosaminyl deacetylase
MPSPPTADPPAILDAPPAVAGRWAARRALAPAWRLPCRPTTLVVPHPDDEVVLFGGLIATQCRRQLPVTVVAVTDGEASHPRLADLAGRRRGEQRRALDQLAGRTGHAIAVHRLGLPDGRVERHGAELQEAIGRACPPDALLVAPWRFDHHCDHEAVGAAAAAVAVALGVDLVEGIFWGWQHRDPATVDARRLVALPLDAEVRRRRNAAVACHRSQTSAANGPPVLGPRDLEPLGWLREHYLVSGAT